MSTDIFIIPEDNVALDADIKSRKAKYMDHILYIFEKHLCEESLPKKLSLFKFKNTNLEVIVKCDNYIPNLQNLQDYYIVLEDFEKCSIIKNIINKIEKLNSIDDDTKQD